ncbi:hypothetical protein BO85DRAFT_240094 [Aspergillus piperis CBS 112811]|uniref:Secreted protein n=1 Tax=Aspergillus piperis CBS 112811 TaxID=1448313 RepID=A0A8G1QQL3_9EURO|nr:hypothetical protein BO85DRAFT_240094 [Aspergillus piperis CBS 112811]RAH51804.1 hypothetical protein BO85DRAFT_240094 [Aspergillus piperis CBS 112811]
MLTQTTCVSSFLVAALVWCLTARLALPERERGGSLAFRGIWSCSGLTDKGDYSGFYTDVKSGKGDQNDVISPPAIILRSLERNKCGKGKKWPPPRNATSGTPGLSSSQLCTKSCTKSSSSLILGSALTYMGGQPRKSFAPSAQNAYVFCLVFIQNFVRHVRLLS